MDNGRLDKVEIADTVLEAAVYVLQDILRYRPTRGQISISPIQYSHEDYTVVTRLTGDITGELFFGMDLSTARGLSSQMLRNVVERLGRLELSALQELGAIVTDSALALLEDRGVLCYSTRASVIIGKDERVTPFAMPALTVPVRMVVGDMRLHILLEGYAPFSWATPSARISAESTITVPSPRETLSLAA